MKQKLCLYIGIFAVLAILVVISVMQSLRSRAEHKDVNELTAGQEQSIVVFAAAGTTVAMQEIAKRYETHYGVTVPLNLASSSTLAKQITAGAPWDVYISANKRWMDYVVEQTGMGGNTVGRLLKDRLALVMPIGDDVGTFSIDDDSFAKGFEGHLALGDPTVVPVGMYSKEALEKLGWWAALQDKVIPAVDVAAAQRYVETGQCEAGIIYLSGARNSKKLTVAHVFDETLHNPIIFTIIVNGDTAGGKAFKEYLLKSSEAEAVFDQYGYQKAEGVASDKQ